MSSPYLKHRTREGSLNCLTCGRIREKSKYALTLTVFEERHQSVNLRWFRGLNKANVG